MEWRSEVEARTEKSGGQVCARPERVSIPLRHAEHSVRIARELSHGGCLSAKPRRTSSATSQ